MPSRSPHRLRAWRLLAGAALLVPVLAGTAGAAEGSVPTTTPPADRDATEQGWIASTMARMTLEDKVGQLFVSHVYGTSVDTTDAGDVASNRAELGVDNAEQLIDTYHVGGIIYFAWAHNVADPQQIAQLSNGIQRVSLAQPAGVPAVITTDQEGGLVYRVGPPATQFPGNMALGAGRSAADAQQAADITGHELRAMGINQDYAPVADVNVNPANPVIGVRSFGSDPDLVATMEAAQVRGYQAGGVAPTAKHFPGHGDTDTDSHTGLPVITHTREQIEQIDLPPFRAAIAAGIDCIMTAHIVVPALDPSGDPATLSHPILTGVLRDELGYDGVVVTDSLGMAGVRQKYGDARVPVLALEAGVDQLLDPPNLDLAYHAVLDAVRSGELTEARIDQSVQRILRLKFEHGIVAQPFVDPAALPSVVGTPEHLAAAQAITDRTVTLVKNDAGTLPMAVSGRHVLVTGYGVTTTATLGNRLRDHGADVTVVTTGISPSSTTRNAAVSAAGGKDLAVVVTNAATAYPNQQALIGSLLQTGTPVVVVAVGNPYDVSAVPQVPTYLATYGYQAVSLASLVRVITGEVNPSGRLPVAIPTAGDPSVDLYPFGYGLSYGG